MPERSLLIGIPWLRRVFSLDLFSRKMFEEHKSIQFPRNFSFNCLIEGYVKVIIDRHLEVR